VLFPHLFSQERRFREDLPEHSGVLRKATRNLNAQAYRLAATECHSLHCIAAILHIK
jgi:hypothetical protein